MIYIYYLLVNGIIIRKIIYITGINPEAISMVGDHHDHPLCWGVGVWGVWVCVCVCVGGGGGGGGLGQWY